MIVAQLMRRIVHAYLVCRLSLFNSRKKHNYINNLLGYTGFSQFLGGEFFQTGKKGIRQKKGSESLV